MKIFQSLKNKRIDDDDNIQKDKIKNEEKKPVKENVPLKETIENVKDMNIKGNLVKKEKDVKDNEAKKDEVKDELKDESGEIDE